jgi:hypothetical protein
LAACAFFILLALPLIPYAGIQQDEALFANPFYESTIRDYRVVIFHRTIPLMVMSYVGTLKSLIYWPILSFFGTSVWSVRLPVVLCGALTVWFLYKLLRGKRGVLAAFLLATDATFLTTNTFDWGPVALEHLLLVTGLWLISIRSGWGFFFLGLALWNKATFVWALSGVLVAGFVVFLPEIRREFSSRKAAIALTAFLAGTLPFLLYNVRRPAATVQQNVKLDPQSVPAKFQHVRYALNGEAVYGYIVTEEWAGNAKTPARWDGRASVWLRDKIGERRRGWLGWAFLFCLAAAPLWWRDKSARFALVFLPVAWILMALTRDAGGAVHHTVLLWPMPHMFIAATLSRVRWGWIAAGVLCVANLLALNQQYAQLAKYGATGNWTDALFALRSELQQIPARRFYVSDWGIVNGVRLLSGGKLPIEDGGAPIANDPPDTAAILPMIDPEIVWVGHVPEREEFKGRRKRLEYVARTAGFQKEMIQIINDSNGRPVFEVFRFRAPRL